MFSLEIAEMVIQKNNIIAHFTESEWNCIDAIGKCSMFTYFSYNIVNYNVPDQEKRDSWVFTLMSYLLVCGSVALFLRAINALKVIDAYRSLIKLLTETLFDMIPFLSILFCMIFMMGMVDLIVHRNQLGIKDREFWVSFVLTYETMLGDNPHIKYFK